MNRGKWLSFRRRSGRIALAVVVCGVAAGVARGQYFDPPDPPGGNSEPMVVDPIAPGLAPIALPPFIDTVPTGTTEVPLPPGGGLPADVPNLAGAAETLSVNASTAFVNNGHLNSELGVWPVIGSDSYAVNVLLRDVLAFSSYEVSETLDVVSVSYAQRDGANSELIASSELIGPEDGGLVWAKFENGSLTELTVVTQNSTDAVVWEYPGGATPQPGLSNAEELQALYDLVDMHLEGPAKALALATYQAMLAEYDALAHDAIGDFNQDNVTDAADYEVWRKYLGTRYFETDYYFLWQANFGQPAGGGSIVSASEPSALLLVLGGLAIVAGTLRVPWQIDQ